MSDKKQTRGIEFEGREIAALDFEDLQKLDSDTYASTSFGMTQVPIKKNYDAQKEKQDRRMGKKP